MQAAVEVGTLAVADLDLEYERRAARRAGPTLVLLHEGLGCVAMWKAFPAELAGATGLEVFSYSRAGYGGSSPVVLPRPLDFHTREASVLPRLLEAARITDCILVGHSDGASIAIVYAGSSRDPRVRALILMAPHVLTEERTLMTIGEAKRAYEEGDLRERLARRHGANVDCAFRGWCDTWLDPGFRAWSVERWLAPIARPVLLVRGEDDPYSTPVHVERVASGVAGPVEVVALADCGHAPHLDQPEATIAHLARFIARVTEGGDFGARR